jgi:UDP-N-acetyl-D-mannosaminuronic acid transferase (WecB/TagA/CpsF family)
MAQQISAAEGDGVIVGQSGDLVGFYGTTPVAVQTATAAPASTAAVSITATQWGFSTSAQADAIVALVRGLRQDLIDIGILAA